MTAQYSDIVMDHIRHPRHAGELAAPDGVGRAGHGEHEYVVIQIRVRDDVITEIAQRAAGCEPVLAAASMVAERAQGKHLDDASHISRDTIVSAMGGLPDDKRHTAGMAAEALANAIWDYVARSVETAITETTKATLTTIDGTGLGKGHKAMIRTNLLRALIEATAPVGQIAPLLAGYPWDSNEKLVVLSAKHVRHVLKCFLSGGMSSKELEDWANAVEGRDDIGFAAEQSESLQSIIHLLANPILEGEVNEIRARDILRTLS
jgi:nitrogen fixation NifU-like protein